MIKKDILENIPSGHFLHKEYEVHKSPGYPRYSGRLPGFTY